MGIYDTVIIDNKVGQFKCWTDEMKTFGKGDKISVEIESGIHTYSVAAREGGYVNIENNIILSWTDEPEFSPVYDKYGGIFTPDSAGIFGEKYFVR